MVNFRVRNLDAMAAQLRAAGTDIEIDPEVYPNGRFARLSDPDGNPIQLWERRETFKVRQGKPILKADKAEQIRKATDL
jgi:hypothetical protein